MVQAKKEVGTAEGPRLGNTMTGDRLGRRGEDFFRVVGKPHFTPPALDLDIAQSEPQRRRSTSPASMRLAHSWVVARAYTVPIMVAQWPMLKTMNSATECNDTLRQRPRWDPWHAIYCFVCCSFTYWPIRAGIRFIASIYFDLLLSCPPINPTWGRTW